MISNETIRKASEIGMLDVLDVVKMVEINLANIIIHGPCGIGKKWLTCALANEAVKQKYIIYYI